MQRSAQQAVSRLRYVCCWECNALLSATLNWSPATTHHQKHTRPFTKSHAALLPQDPPHSFGFPASKSQFAERSCYPQAPLQRISLYSTRPVDQSKLDTPYTISNAISLLRLVSAPGVAWLIATEQWDLAVAAVSVAGLSDWLDGYLAKVLKQQSVLGSYLDPLADKAVVGAAIGALGWVGSIPAELVAGVVLRDALLVSAHFYHRATVLGWNFKSAREFFKTTEDKISGVQPAEPVQPLLSGKLSTVVQFGLIATCTVTSALGFAHGNHYVQFWVINTYLWTAVSGLQYLYICNWLSDSFKLRAVGAGILALAVYQFNGLGLENFQM